MKKSKRWLIGAIALLLAPATSMGQSPYSGLQERPLKALSQEQVEDLLAGRGMGLALAAELNGYPGPKHVLELAQELNLDEHQREEIERVFAAMSSEAITLGQTIVDLESSLDAGFADGSIDAQVLQQATEQIGRLNGTLRGVHLAAHLVTVEILSPHQRALYIQARGYGDSVVHDPSHHNQ